MGSPVSPILCNLFMENFENKAIAQYHTPQRYWRRYVDDTLCILDKYQAKGFFPTHQSITQLQYLERKYQQTNI